MTRDIIGRSSFSAFTFIITPFGVCGSLRRRGWFVDNNAARFPVRIGFRRSLQTAKAIRTSACLATRPFWHLQRPFGGRVSLQAGHFAAQLGNLIFKTHDSLLHFRCVHRLIDVDYHVRHFAPLSPDRQPSKRIERRIDRRRRQVVVYERPLSSKYATNQLSVSFAAAIGQHGLSDLGCERLRSRPPFAAVALFGVPKCGWPAGRRAAFDRVFDQVAGQSAHRPRDALEFVGTAMWTWTRSWGPQRAEVRFDRVRSCPYRRS